MNANMTDNAFSMYIYTVCPKLTSPRFGRMDNSLVNEGKMEVATFNCFKGYRLNGPSTIYCEERYWSEENVSECKRVVHKKLMILNFTFAGNSC